MNTSALRQQLHQYIDKADDSKIEAMFIMLQSDMAHTSTYTDDELKKFYERRNNYTAANTQTYTAEETKEYARQQKK